MSEKFPKIFSEKFPNFFKVRFSEKLPKCFGNFSLIQIYEGKISKKMEIFHSCICISEKLPKIF